MSLLWYRRYSRRRQYPHLDEGNDLIFDEGDEREPDEELQRVFSEAAKVAKSLGGNVLDQRDQLMLYGLYKQATEGDQQEAGRGEVSFLIESQVQML
jgi:hypothetical protein